MKNSAKKSVKEHKRKVRQFTRAKEKFLRDNPGSTYSVEKGARDPAR